MTEDMARTGGSDMVTGSKNRVKNKARLQLWDSLLDIYAKEAENENLSDCEEIDMNETEHKANKRPGDVSRGRIQLLADRDPQLILRAMPGAINFGNEEDLPQAKRKRKINTSSTPSLSKKVSRSVKNKKSNDKKISVKTPNRKQIKRKKLKQDLPKSLTSIDVVSDRSKDSSDHKCKVSLRYYNENTNSVKRADGRVFSCRLVFRVSQCCESDELF